MVCKWLLLLGVVVCSASREGRVVDQNLLRQNLANTPFRLSDGMNRFAHNVYDILTSDQSGNVVVSPFSLHTSLSMVFFGSPSNSQTHQELVRLLGMPVNHYAEYPYNYLSLLARYENMSPSQNIQVQFANRIYADDTFEAKEDFMNLLRIFYRTTVDEVDFAQNIRAVRVINRFVQVKTKNLIRSLLEPSDVDAFTRMVLINAIYFKADWKYKFNSAQTSAKPFTVNGETFSYPHTMTQTGDFGIASLPEIGADVLEIPYENEEFRMLVFLPADNAGIIGLDSRIKNFNVSSVNRRLVYGPTRVQLPRFKTGSKAEMSSVFARLGAPTLFDTEKADLSDISDEEQLAVQKIVHKAELEVNEEGSEAAAATGTVIGTRTAGAAKLRSFIVDRPFVFIIQDKKYDIPLFMGRIVDPSGQRQLGEASPALSLALTALKQEDGDLAQEDLPDCKDGQKPTTRTDQISFPCKGRDTAHVEANQQHNRQSRMAALFRRFS